MKSCRNAAVMLLALGTAYGLGIISCVAYEVKLFAEVVSATKKDADSQNE